MIGWLLVLAGALSTVPLAIHVFRKKPDRRVNDRPRADVAAAAAH